MSKIDDAMMHYLSHLNKNKKKMDENECSYRVQFDQFNSHMIKIVGIDFIVCCMAHFLMHACFFLLYASANSIEFHNQ